MATPEIPAEYQRCLLPIPQLSIMKLLRFPLALPVSAAQDLTADAFFSTDEPNATEEQCKSLNREALPAKEDLERLMIGMAGKIGGGAKSVIFAHTTFNHTRYPLWVISFWQKVSDIHDLFPNWFDSQRWLELGTFHMKSAESRMALERVYAQLDMIPWSGILHGFSGTPSVHTLTSYLGNEWLTDEHIEQQLHLLRERLTPQQRTGVFVPNVFFPSSLLMAYNSRESVPYSSSKNNWLRDYGRALSEGHFGKMMSVANINNNHWVAYMVDTSTSTLFIGDSMSDKSEPELISLIHWWLSQHGLTLKNSRMPIGAQVDGDACGIYAINAVHHQLNPDVPLMTHKQVRYHRMKTFSEVVDYSLRRAFVSGI